MQCPTDITEYQHNIDQADKGGHIFLHGAGFSAKSHLKSATREDILGFVTSDF